MSAVQGLRPRMFSPELFTADDLEPIQRRVLFLGMIALCEDSGCLAWPSPAQARALLLPYEETTVAEVQSHLRALVDSGRVTPYTADGRQYAYLRDFHRWQRLTRWNAPREAPLPAWISFTPDATPNRYGSGTYTWREPGTEQTANDQTEPNLTEPNLTEPKGPARTLPAPCAQPVNPTFEECGF